MRAPILIGFGIAGLFLILPSISEAAQTSTQIVSNALDATVLAVTGQLQSLAIKWLSAFMLAQFLITNLGLLKSGADIEAVWGKFAGSLLWFGFCFYLVDNGAAFISKVGGSIFVEAGTIAGGQGAFTTGNIFSWGLRLCDVLMVSVNAASGGGWFPTLDFLPSLLTFVACLIILAVSALIGFKIFLIKIELVITVMMTPLSFSFMALSALKDQGMAPFKSLISLIYRVMILAVIVSAMDKTGIAIEAAFKAVANGSEDEIWSPVFAALMVYALFGYLAFKSDSMAANLASGSTSLGTGDVAQAAAAGAAAAAALATGGAAAAGGASKGAQAMGDFMKGLGGGGGSIKNASSQGSGSSTAGTAPARPAALSASGASFGTNKAGAPVKESNSGKGQSGEVAASRADVSGNQSGVEQTASPASGGDSQHAAGSATGTGESASSPGSSSTAAGQSGPGGAARPEISAGPAAASSILDGGSSQANPSGNDAGKAPTKPNAAPAPPAASQSATTAGGRRAPVRPNAMAQPAAGAMAKPAATGGPQPSTAPVVAPSATSSANPRASTGPSVGSADGTIPAAAGSAAGPSSNGPGSGANAGIAGPTSPLEQKVDKLLENASRAPKRSRPTLSDRLGTLNEHVAKESAATHVSINVNAD